MAEPIQGVIPGITYLETKIDLIENTRTENISDLETTAENHTCYFCLQKNNDPMLIFRQKKRICDVPTQSHYYGHSSCYDKAKKDLEPTI